MSWWGDVVKALHRIIQIEDRMEGLSTQVKTLADNDSDQDHRLTRIEAKFELLERMGALRRGSSSKEPTE